MRWRMLRVCTRMGRRMRWIRLGKWIGDRRVLLCNGDLFMLGYRFGLHWLHGMFDSLAYLRL